MVVGCPPPAKSHFGGGKVALDDVLDESLIASIVDCAVRVYKEQGPTAFGLPHLHLPSGLALMAPSPRPNAHRSLQGTNERSATAPSVWPFRLEGQLL